MILDQVVLQGGFESRDASKTWKGGWRKALLRIKDSIAGDTKPRSLKNEVESVLQLRGNPAPRDCPDQSGDDAYTAEHTSIQVPASASPGSRFLPLSPCINNCNLTVSAL